MNRDINAGSSMKSKFILSALAFMLSTCFIAHPVYAGMNVTADCMIKSGACVREIEQEKIKVTFDINPKPVSPMKELIFSVTLAEKGSPVTDASVIVELTMPGMYMGINSPALVHTADGRYEGKGVIQACPHGGKIWMAEVKLTRHNKTVSVSFIFEVE
jgi:hypothetical protein